MAHTRRRKPAQVDPSTLLEGLNPEQQEVVQHHKGPALVVAVAGAGKTRALVHRIAYLIAHHGVDPFRIMAVTFSKKAAGEMNDRLWKLGVRDARVGTWHSVAWEILKEERPETSEWELDDRDRFRGLVKIVLGYQHMKWDTADLTTVLSYIGLCKAGLADPGSDRAREIAQDLFDTNPCSQNAPDLLGEAYSRSLEEQAQRRMLTFDDMLVGCHKVLLDEESESRWRGRFDYVLQDEAQDENHAQSTIGAQLAGGHRNYMLVGDPGQSIYGFRGAVPQKLLSFEKEWGAKVIKMQRNYRSGPEIIAAANGVIRAMDPSSHLGLEMVAEVTKPAEVVAREFHTMDDEGEAVAMRLMEAHADGTEWRDMSVLFRTNAQSRGIEEACLSNRIPFVLLGGTNFYDRKEVKDLLAYLRIAAGRGHFDDVRRCINAPFRYLGKAFVQKIEANDLGLGTDWAQAVRKTVDSARLQRRQGTSARQWAGLIDGLTQSIVIQREHREATDTVSDNDRERHFPAALLERIISDTDYMRYITRDEGAETVENNRVSNVRELVRAAERFVSVDELLDYIDHTLQAAKEAQGRDRGNRLTLCSLHRSKGLEWPAVFVLGCNEKLLPHGRATDIDEERRLFYVGVTRAKEILHLSCVQAAAFGANVVPLEPSRFLEEAGIELQEAS